MHRPLYVYALAVVATFTILGAGFGLAANFTLGFFIEQFVEPGTDPLDVTQVGIMLLVSIFFIYTLGPVMAGIAGITVGQVLPDRRTAAGVVAGVSSFVGFYLFVGLALFLTFSVLSEYGAEMSGGGPLDPSALGPLMVQVSLPVSLVGLATGYITSRISGAANERDTGGTGRSVGAITGRHRAIFQARADPDRTPQIPRYQASSDRPRRKPSLVTMPNCYSELLWKLTFPTLSVEGFGAVPDLFSRTTVPLLRVDMV